MKLSKEKAMLFCFLLFVLFLGSRWIPRLGGVGVGSTKLAKHSSNIPLSSRMELNNGQPTPTPPKRGLESANFHGVWHIVTRVIDGDTIELETGERVRYIGMNTPETVDPRKAVECFGKEASNFNKSLVEGKKILLVKDVSEKDKYGRLLRFVYLEDGTFVNLKLVEAGYASVMTVTPDVRFAGNFLSAEKTARADNIGLWQKCIK